jgi:hypothetical protein
MEPARVSLEQTLASFQRRRRFPDWQPVAPSSRHHIDAATVEVIRRICSLLDLEVTVGEWVTDALHALPSSEHRAALSYINRNSSDESKHDSVMRHLAQYVGLSEREDPSARAIVDAWQKQQPSFALAYALEMGVFMSILPWLTKNGDMYCVKCAQWIADDEGVHVLTNRELATVLGQPVTRDMGILVKQTLEYIFGAGGDTVARALRRLQTGTDSAMMNESVAVTPAFFEQHDKRSIKYY